MSTSYPRFSRFTRATRWARRMAFLVHRWLGIALALLMAIWAVSGGFCPERRCGRRRRAAATSPWQGGIASDPR